MLDHNLILIYLKPLNCLQIDYIVTGSVASIFYGEPRLTFDIDLIITLNNKDIPGFVQAFPLSEFYVPPEEVIKVENLRTERGHFNLIHHETGYKADIYLSGQNKLHTWAMNHYHEYEIQEQIIRVAPVEYVIIKKLEYYKEGQSQKHLSDIKGILNQSIQDIDHALLNNFIQEYSLQKEWALICP